MAELINNITCRPRRVQAIFNVLKKVDKSDSRNFYMYFCSTEITIEETLQGCELIGLIKRQNDQICLTNEYEACDDWNGARKKIALNILSARNKDDHNYRFCQFYGWLINYKATIIRPNDYVKLAEAHNRELNLSSETGMNKIKVERAQDWAVELGLGWWWKDPCLRFEAIPTEFIEWLLPELLEDNPIEGTAFIDKVSNLAPWIASSTKINNKTQELSSGLSQSLRQLHETNKIKLITSRDALSITQFNNLGFQNNDIGYSFCQISKPGVLQ